MSATEHDRLERDQRLAAWKAQQAEREVLASSYDYTQVMARRCAGQPSASRLAFAFGALVQAVKNDARDRDDLKVLARELDIACGFEVTS